MRVKKKPVEVEAYQWTKEDAAHLSAAPAWPNWLQQATELEVSEAGALWGGDKGLVYITTLEGNHEVTVNDWIICGVKGELYPCKPDIFDMTYDIVPDFLQAWS